ncbi:hypothetical protein [Companilactobacillus sp.]|jgi:hypothetical protein|uniref:hypothetical protein n=1 Tax=Companilactobacillus sp. TaxID=2767905 RepID=UPI0025C5123D|nr:hypothetical protein [Companilactobacillus sp.]MCH4010066.1 DUF4097 domain-containing protein [Companilactobacillus sp.]MCH4052258.1 DUF4097 domain-containing protein [Companilactobacillus sp.]MCH4078008.1 DUF4097 domain-containing protein [Companilactobacillus sp.]MCH4126584.1 DUF4097 domain-containing protein [Companilactobacillus sp.]MCH4132169.1 DUF4097 domain-containing protein [Companilactobacillus sp.]
MRRTAMVTGVYLLVIGLILATIGLITNAPKNVIWNHGFQVSKTIDQTKQVKPFHSIKVNGGEGEVFVGPSDGTTGNHFSVQVKGDDKRIPKYEVKNDTLYITRKSASSGFTISGRQEIYVSIPRNTKLNDITATLSLDKTQFSNLTTKTINLRPMSDNGDGRLFIEGLRVLKSGTIDAYNARTEILNSNLNNVKIISYDYMDEEDSDDAEDYQDINDNDYLDLNDASLYIHKSNLKNSQINLNSGGLVIGENSILDNVKFTSQLAAVKVSDSKLINQNDFYIKKGSFRSNNLTMDGVDLSNQSGLIQYQGDSTNDHVYQANPGAENILRVNGDKLAIRIK